jgi:flagellar assembly protein FliH
MQERLLSLEAEEMTSLSKIIRGVQAQQLEKHTIEIQLRNMFTPDPIDPLEGEEEKENQLTLEEVLQERNRILEEARLQMEGERAQFEAFQQSQLASIEELKAVWEEEKIQLEQQAYDEAFSKGFEEGMQKASSQMADSIKRTNEIMDLARINAEKYMMEQEQVILDLAIKCSGKIIGYELEGKEEAFVSIIKRGLKEVRELQNIKVYISHEYYPLVSNYRDELAELFPPDVQFLIFVNEDLQDEQCYIETNHGRVIVSVDEQLQELRSKLSEILDSKE